MNSDCIPYDLMIDIFSRLPKKSIARFHCVSKQWSSMFHSQDFTKLFLTRSSARPRLLFAIKGYNEWSFYSSPQLQNPYEKSSSSLEVAAEFHTNFPPENMAVYRNRKPRSLSCGYASGLIYFNGMWISGKDEKSGVPVICNPNTGGYATLPKLRLSRYKIPNSLFGFDPIDKQFKVLFMTRNGDYTILTLGTTRWRKIHCPINHEPLSESICIDGVLYYLAEPMWPRRYSIVCFDVRSEKFEIIYYPEYYCQLVNYMGKLGLIYLDYCDDDAIVLHEWVLEDLEKKEWSEYAYILRDDKFLHNDVSVVGVTATGEIVLSMTRYTSKQPFYVFYFNPKTKTLRSVEIKGLGAGHNEEYGENFSVHTFVNHVEDLNANDGKLLKSSIYGQYVKTEEKYHCEDKDGEYDNNYVDEGRDQYDYDSGDDYRRRYTWDYGYDYVYEYGDGDESEEGEMENEREKKKNTKKVKVKEKKKVKHPNQKGKQHKRLHTDAKEEAATRTM
ncbi:unnamed protein product [Microthlaspi erraticum]|uniref:F-box domain-containing protein n=1 Tax=Microthlaspi erraticum TaxID=1685480 RepID=A0A6D2KIE7_9BRAS|nr:unnamed protein product [Microthlaspi erraticum]